MSTPQETYAAEVDALLTELRAALLGDDPEVQGLRTESSGRILRVLERDMEACGSLGGAVRGMPLAQMGALYALSCRREGE